MKTRKRQHHQGRRESGTFVALSHNWLKSPQWAALNPYELKLLIDLASQYNGKNNGDLCAAVTVLKGRGWRSSATLNKSIHSLIEKGWLELTRQGGRHSASLFALTVWGIDGCGGKHDLKPNPVPSHRWKTDGLKNWKSGRVVNQCGRAANQSGQRITNISSLVVVS